MESVISELVLVSLAAMMSPTTLTFSVLVLILGERPLRSGILFYLGALTATLAIGVLGAFFIGDIAASTQPTPKTPVAVIDVIAGVLVLFYVFTRWRKPPDRTQVQAMVTRVGRVADSPATAVIAAGATLANPGGFIPLALKEISQTGPTTAEYLLEWIGFALVSLLPLAVALIALAVAPAPTQRVLVRVRDWLIARARNVAMVILLLLAVALLRNGIAGLSG